MKNKNLLLLILLAAILGIAAYLLNSGSKPSTPRLNGRTLLPDLEVSSIAKIECGKLVLSAGDNGWVIDSYFGYPASRERLINNLLRLAELKVGQVVRGKKPGSTTALKLFGADGATLGELNLGEKHPKYGHGRYLVFEGETVLVADALEPFDGDEKQWLNTKIVDEPWISFNRLAQEKDEAIYGFATGVVAKVTIAGDTNRTITVGAPVKGGSDRYLKLDGEKWVYEVSNYSVEKFLPKSAETK